MGCPVGAEKMLRRLPDCCGTTGGGGGGGSSVSPGGRRRRQTRGATRGSGGGMEGTTQEGPHLCVVEEEVVGHADAAVGCNEGHAEAQGREHDARDAAGQGGGKEQREGREYGTGGGWWWWLWALQGGGGTAEGRKEGRALAHLVRKKTTTREIPLIPMSFSRSLHNPGRGRGRISCLRRWGREGGEGGGRTRVTGGRMAVPSLTSGPGRCT